MKKHRMQHASNYQSGQVLLLIVLFITSLLTVVMSLSFRAARDTQITLAQTEVSDLQFVAETAAEQAIARFAEESDTFGPGSQISYQDLFTYDPSDPVYENVNLDASSIFIDRAFITDEFESPSLDKDQQYVFYLSEYIPFEDGTIEFGPAYDNDLEIAIRTGHTGGNDVPCSSVSLELTVVHGRTGAYDVKRFAVDKAELFAVTGDIRNFIPERQDRQTGEGLECVTVLRNEAEPDAFREIRDKRLLIARVLYTDTDVGEVRIAVRPLNGATLPPQGLSYVSEAFSKAGLRKKVTVFQSYPQIPADLFVTSF